MGLEKIRRKIVRKDFAFSCTKHLKNPDKLELFKTWMNNYDYTAKVWNDNYFTDYRDKTVDNFLYENIRIKTKVDNLVNTIIHQSSFYEKINKLGPKIVNKAYIENAIERYLNFLVLAKNSKGDILVPTLDIDLIWHVHMLSPLDYNEDCETIGYVLNHDVTIENSILESQMQKTQDLWYKQYQEPYITNEKQKIRWKVPTLSSSSLSSNTSNIDVDNHDGLKKQKNDQTNISSIKKYNVDGLNKSNQKKEKKKDDNSSCGGYFLFLLVPIILIILNQLKVILKKI